MIALSHNHLEFSFPEVHPLARLSIEFQRTLRIPDDGTDYPLPAGLGAFPLEHVDDHLRTVPGHWLDHGGVMLPMYQSEAMWINFESSYISDRQTGYPFAVKIAAGKIDAVTGESWIDQLQPSPQNYVLAPKQPWLDGFCVEQGVIRQFVAMPLGQGYTAEEQITGEAQFGGLQVMVYPMKGSAFERNHPVLPPPPPPQYDRMVNACYSMDALAYSEGEASEEMGLGAGGRMRQQIYTDHYEFADWDLDTPSRCFIHLTNSQSWQRITGKTPPTVPLTAQHYEQSGLPWFNWYEEQPVVSGSSTLRKIKSIAQLGKEKKQHPVAENDPVKIEKVIELREALMAGQVREGEF